jgi:thiosulfate/3-mercaptopyruvate sulfurtransferase
MSYAHPEALVDTSWLAAHLEDPNLRLLDGSHHIPTTGRNARAEYDRAHIPGAVFFDIDEIADPDTDLPHMLPSAGKFAADVGALGIGNDTKVVIYDAVGTTGAARVWWTFRVFGHGDVVVLDGGLPKWLAEGRPTTAEIPAPPARPYRAEKNLSLVRDLEQVRGNIEARREQVLDARSAGRFAATEPEPRAGMRGGHIPGSLNLPFTQLFNPDRTFKDADSLRRIFGEAGLDMARPITTTCGSGVTASVLALALYLIGRKDVAVYDGSWSEWGGRPDTPIEP